MELSSAVVTPSPSPSPSPTTTASTPDTDTDTPPTTHLSKALLSLPTSSFRRYRHPSPPPPLVVYRECLKNHAATLGGHALDGCGEFMPAPTATPTDPTSLKCAACGCHRNFHRRDPEPPLPHSHLLEYHPNPSPYPISPPPISSSYYPSALLALSTGVGFSGKPENTQQNTTSATTTTPNSNSNGGRKRHRTKFSEEQKEKMYSFSEKLGWKMQKRDQGLVEEFCTQVGVAKGVLKVWMHNNKHTFGKRDPPTHLTAIGIGMDNLSVHPTNSNNDDDSTHQVAANSASS